jgi:hypothetical protein
MEYGLELLKCQQNKCKSSKYMSWIIEMSGEWAINSKGEGSTTAGRAAEGGSDTVGGVHGLSTGQERMLNPKIYPPPHGSSARQLTILQIG